MSTMNVSALLDQMAHTLMKERSNYPSSEVQLVGIRTGGVWLARELAERIGHTAEIGELNISFYRDDFTQIGLHPQVSPSSLPFSVEGAHLILVDDVLMSGRTIRAAMNELFDYGRPASIALAVLIDLNQRQLPISADVVGTKLQLEPNERVKLMGPDMLRVEVQTLSTEHGR